MDMKVSGASTSNAQELRDMQEMMKAARERKPENTPEETPDKKQADVVTISTDKVDGELSALRNKKAQLTQSLRGAGGTDSDLQKELAQVENELREKDNDAYRRQNADVRQGVDIQA